MEKMWDKINNFVRANTILSAFLLTTLFMLPIMAAGITFITGMEYTVGLPIFTMCQLVLTAIGILLMRKLQVFEKNDFQLRNVGKGLLLGWLILVFAIISFVINLTSPPEGGYITSNPLFLLAVILAPFIGTGLFEETVFRGLVLKTVLKKMGSTKKGMINACVISSVIFGVIHLFNLSWVDNSLSVVSQVFFAFAVGVFLAAIYLRTKTLLAPMLLHGIMNLSSQIFDAFTNPDFIIQRDRTTGDITEIVIQTSILVILLLIVAFILLRKVEPETIEENN
jgi:membrane protease YdiL (CAAX protease family)